jgi:pyruvate dehydrogenase E2 component (dihydrolipoamide acetyltransferase)
MSEFRMPSLGADMESGTLVDWRVKPGDIVKRGDVIALVETEKGVIEVEIFENGVVDSIIVHAGEKVPVGTTLALIRGNGGAVPTQASAQPVPVVERKPLPIIESVIETPRKRISPLARKRAEDLAVDLASVVGSGEGGSITVADIERAGSRVAVTPARAAREETYAAMRRVIAAAMARSKREIPHYYLSASIDMHRSLNWLAEENGRRSVTKRLLHSVLLIRATALAAREVPEINGFWKDGAFQPSDGVHVGVAISLRQGGLVNPAIHDVDKKRLDELMEQMLDLVNRARSGRLRSSELSDGTITVTNLGDQGVEGVFGVIYPPQVALVGFGKITDRPVAINGMLGIRPILEASLSGDHRVSDGHRGGRFLLAIDRFLQEPEKL